MAEAPTSRLVYGEGCPDCGERQVALPPPLPGVYDDFDWLARDYDSFRLFMMEELASRAPERGRWNVADLEVVLVEVLAAALDRLSHALDTLQRERFLETARRPQSVRRLLAMIGYDPRAHLPRETVQRVLPELNGVDPATLDDTLLETLWRRYPPAMEEARRAGPQSIGEQRRMVTLADHARWVEAHPLIARASARTQWSGSWNTVLLSLLPGGDHRLDHPLDHLPPKAVAEIRDFHRARRVPLPPPRDGDPTRLAPGQTCRTLLRLFIERYRMIGSEVLMRDAEEVGVSFLLSVRVEETYFRSEVASALKSAFSAGPGGFFERGRLDFGQPLYASDIIERAMSVEGVRTACLNGFKRVGRDYEERMDEGWIPIAEDEIAICQNRSDALERGYFRLTLHGGLT